MKKASSARDTAGLFSDHECGKPSSNARSVRTRGAKHLVDAIVDGKPAHVFVPPSRPLERAVEIQIRVALTAAGHIVWKHTVETCHGCGRRPTERTGLGEGTADLIVIHRVTGRFVGIEVKRPGYSPSDVRPRQTIWLDTVTRFNGIVGIATSVEEALAIMARAG